ncbi:Gfo/Idh/MocA family oxidoreductase [Palleronia sp. LCG004]|uniref:Gfo/Idh/MocA family protein n=1 Tax=Palleronia sp. LCG004 TaxID=3079304 RepID=UPI0029426DD3|nr:Gfo/Idh/MocA family oxidoreductase [Palleronia sp. LCG004]WOI58412.1 Gfo/Idh/MocA family oxidoreductase [Palleronia sp. LCG004]
MSRKTKIAVVGLGKMGLSHFSIVNAHPDVDCVACDATGFLIDVLGKNLPNTLYKSYDKMLAEETLDAVVIATPSRHHASMVRAALERGIHVFCEKPFCLDWREGDALASLAEEKGLIGQVGYHYRYVGAFKEMQKVLASGALGDIHHILAEAYGPVVLRPKRQTWRTQKAEGGGCLYDYAAHPLNLLNWVFGTPERVSGSHLNSIFSAGTDDEVLSTLKFPGGQLAQLSVNWSDESHRKMSTKISLIGTNGRMNVDRQECQIYLRKASDALPDYGAGWSVRYTTDLTEDPWFYLRGEEYSAQIADFVEAVAAGETRARENDFRSAAMTDQTIAMIVDDAGNPGTASVTPAPAVVAGKTEGGRGWRSLFGR